MRVDMSRKTCNNCEHWQVNQPPEYDIGKCKEKNGITTSDDSHCTKWSDSEPEQQSDSCNAICPYCHNEYQVECDAYCEEGVEETCDACGKTYFRETVFSVDHVCTPLRDRVIP
jgi:hypothetical protein